MSVNVRIKQKSLFKKKLGINEIIKISGLSYGIFDENYRLIENEISFHTLIYDNKKLARGIDVSLEKTDILFMLNLPTSISEIKCFYNVIEKICNELKIDKFIREEELVSLKDIDYFIKCDKDGSIAGIKHFSEQIKNSKYSNLEVFGVYNPISIGIKEVEEIDNNLDNFGNLLYRLQSLDVYYSIFKVYKVNKRLVGICTIGDNIPSVVPNKPYILLNKIDVIENWYVLNNEKTIKYEDFINNVRKKEYYDANHVIVTVTEEEFTKLIDKYSVEL